MTDVEIKVENIVSSATLGKSIDLPSVAPALEGVEYNQESFPGLVYKLKEPKTAALIFGSGNWYVPVLNQWKIPRKPYT